MPRTLLYCALALLSLGLGFGACAEVDDGEAPPRDVLRFPTGLALTPEGAGPRRLLVASSNFDLLYRAGMLHAFELDALDRLADEAPVPSGCPAGVRCRPSNVPDLRPALVGAVEVGSFGGQVAVAALADRVRAFLPIRDTDTVVAADLIDDELRCAEGGADCREQGVDFSRDDPFGAAVVGENLYVAHLAAPLEIGVVGAARVDSPIWTGAPGVMREIGLGTTPSGALAGRCWPTGPGEAPCAAGGTVYVAGRSREEGSNPFFVFDFEPGELISGQIFSRDLFGQQRGFDARAVAVATDEESVYLLHNAPEALAMISISRVAPPPPDGCVAAPSGAPPGGACPSLSSPTRPVAVPRLTTERIVATPDGPTELAVLPRTLPDGTQSDLIAVSSASSVAFYDARAGVLAGEVSGVGSAPGAIAWRPHGAGFRLYVAVFGRGSIAVIDLPEPFSPRSARVIARLGGPQEGGF